jgi:predicted site-specific integrase-resolvase
MKLPEKNDEPKKAFAYVRVKSNQSDFRNSLIRQKKQINETANRLNIEIVEWIEQLGGSTKMGKNKYLLDGLKLAAKNPDVKYILVCSPDRLSRNFQQLMLWLVCIKNLNLVLLMPGSASLDGQSPEEILMNRLAAFSTDYHSRIRSAMIKRGNQKKNLQASK